MKYHYFVSYSHSGAYGINSFGFGNAELVMSTRATSIDHLKEFAGLIQNMESHPRDVVILNYVLLRKER